MKGKNMDKSKIKPKTVGIYLEIEESIINRLIDKIMIKRMTGEFYGEEDEFAELIIQAIEKGEDKILILQKASKAESE